MCEGVSMSINNKTQHCRSTVLLVSRIPKPNKKLAPIYGGYMRRLTRAQKRNRIIMRRWWRSFKKESELMLPFLAGIIIFGLIVINFLRSI